MPASPRTDLPLRIVVRNPPEGVLFAVQVGREALSPPDRSSPAALVFEVSVHVDPASSSGSPRLLGPVVQGPPSGRFLYVNSGKRAGQSRTHWDRRAKVPLTGISWELIRAQQDAPGSRLEAEIAGTGKDGGPCCATVPLLDGGWRLR